MRTLHFIIVVTAAVIILYGINYYSTPQPKFRNNQRVAVKTLNGDPGTVLDFNSETEVYSVQYYDSALDVKYMACRDSELVPFSDDSLTVR